MLDRWPEPTDFVHDALCAQVDSETFFPQKELGLNTAREAKHRDGEKPCGPCLTAARIFRDETRRRA